MKFVNYLSSAWPNIELVENNHCYYGPQVVHNGNCHNCRECIAYHRVVYQTMETFVLPKQLSVFIYICTVGTHVPSAYSSVTANTTTIHCTLGHSAHSSCPTWLSFISVIFQAQLGANCLAGCQRNQVSKCQVTAHRLWCVAIKHLSAKGNCHN